MLIFILCGGPKGKFLASGRSADEMVALASIDLLWMMLNGLEIVLTFGKS
jgi:hypothetical protein